MEPSSWQVLLAGLALVLASAFLAAAEIAVLSLGRHRLQELAQAGRAPARLLLRLLDHPASMLSALLVAVTTLNYLAAALGAAWLMVRLGPGWGIALAALGVGLFLLLVADMIPSTWAAANPARLALLAAYPLRALTWLLYPVAVVLVGLANGIVRLLAPRREPEPEGLSEQQIRSLVALEAEQGGLEEEERAMIHSIFDFEEKLVREIMVARPDIVAVPADRPLREAAAACIEHRFSRLPVYEGNLDHVIGVVNAKDLLGRLESGGEQPVREVMRPAYVVPATKGVGELLAELRGRKQPLAVVVDERGATAGLVTIEDILEQVVGEIYDEYDVGQPSPDPRQEAGR